MDKYFYPIPKEDLLARFRPVFLAVSKGQSATLIALPHTGRTSHFRFIISQSKYLPELSIPSKIKLVDSDVTKSNLTSYLSEILSSLDDSELTRSALYSKDDYLIFNQLRQVVQSLTADFPLTLILTLKADSIGFFSDLDKFIVNLQKSALKNNLTIVWSLETSIHRQIVSSHPSSSLSQNIVYFPTFSETETIHSITRLFKTSQKNYSLSMQKDIFSQTKGIAGLFHLFVDGYPSFIDSEPGPAQIVSDLKIELNQLPLELQKKLILPKCVQLLALSPNTQTKFKSILLKNQPTSQEISLLNFFLSKPNQQITRDEVANIIWGKQSNVKYSDWAIDKAISRLRSKISSSNYQLMTVKNLGYQLIVV
jgi:hypothetical protein